MGLISNKDSDISVTGQEKLLGTDVDGKTINIELPDLAEYVSTYIGAVTSVGQMSFIYDETSTAVGADTGTFRFNNASPTAATAIYFDIQDSSGLDTVEILENLGNGSEILMKQGDNFVLYQVTSGTDNSSYFTFVVNPIDSSAEALVGQLPTAVTLFAIGGVGGGGINALSEDVNPTLANNLIGGGFSLTGINTLFADEAQLDSLLLNATDIEPNNTQGMVYFDLSEQAVKVNFEGTGTFTKLLKEGDADLGLAAANQFITGSVLRYIDIEAATTLLFTRGGTTIATVNGSNNTFEFNNITVPASTYGVSWNGSNIPATRNDVYDKIELLFTEIDFSNAVDISIDDTGSYFAGTNVEAALQEIGSTNTAQGDSLTDLGTRVTDIETALATTPASSLVYEDKTANYTLVATDANDNVILRLNYDNEEVTITAGVFDQGNVIKLVKHPSAPGETRIVNDSTTSIQGYTDGIILGAYPSGVTLSRTTSATAPEVWEVIDYFGSISDYSSATNLLTNGDMSSSTGWTLQNGSTISGGVGTVVGAGSPASTGNNHSIERAPDVAFVNGNNYRVVISMRLVSGSGNFYISQDFLVWQTIATSGLTGSFVEYEYTGNTANSNTNFTLAADSGVTVEVDYVFLYAE